MNEPEIDENAFDVNVFEIMEPPSMLNELYSKRMDYQSKSDGIGGYLNMNTQNGERFDNQTNKAKNELNHSQRYYETYLEE